MNPSFAAATQPLSIAQRFRQSCRTHASRIALIQNGEGVTYEELFRAASSFANHLDSRQDFRPGTHVGLNLPNSAEYIAAFYGTLLASGIVIPVSTQNSPQRIQQLFSLAQVELRVSLPVSAAQSLAKQPDTVVIESTELGQTAFRFDLNEGSETLQSPDLPASDDDLAMMLFTSGSSGDPKAVMLSHGNLSANCDSICAFLPISSDERALAVTPFSHALGNSVLQTHILSGATLVFGSELRYATEQLAAIHEYQCTSLTAVPEVFDQLAIALRSKEAPPNSLRYLAVAGGRLDPARSKTLQDFIAPAQFFLMYGQTEATARLAYLPPNLLSENASTIGHAIPDVELEIRDDNQNAISTGQTGTLYARGKNIMLGYWNDAESNVLQDGWLNTGDLARINGNGLIEILGRRGGLVKIQSHRFHPLEVEKLLASELSETQIVVVPFSFFGHTRLAMFARATGVVAVDQEKLRQVCRDVLPRHMLPQRIEVLDTWPTNANGKIDRSALAIEATGFDRHRQILPGTPEVSGQTHR